MSNLLSLPDLTARKLKLEAARAALKREFFGIDGPIDKVIESVQTWYLLPQVVVRPPIVCLFGMSGTGKTSLIRSLVAHLEFSDRFLEVQMDGFSSGGSGPSSISNLLSQSQIQEGQPGIVLLDEFQRFRTINEDKEDIKLERYADVWMLLSDGHFPSDHTKLERIIEWMDNENYREDDNAYDKAVEEAEEEAEKPTRRRRVTPKKAIEVAYKRRFYLYRDEAKSLKYMLRLPEAVGDIMMWDRAKIRALIEARLESKKETPFDYTKCLVFVCGNLDEAFQMASAVEDCDTSADVFHQHTLKIGPVEIKSALATRFRPEQIARLGNNHIIYPSLPKSAYEQLIKRTCLTYVAQAQAVCGVTFTIDDAVYQEIYENSVYPTQGTRPVFTSIHKLFGSPLSDGILWALENEETDVRIGLDATASTVTFAAGSQVRRIKIDFDIRARRKSRTADFNSLVAVHEAGHALIYALLFKQAPVEVAINVASFKGGYNLFNDTFLCKSEVLDKIAMGLGGIAAEELVFGDDLRSTGCESDIMSATRLAGRYVRRWGMDRYDCTVMADQESLLMSGVEDTDVRLDLIIETQKQRAMSLVREHRSLLLDISNQLVKVQKMDAKAFVAFVGGRIPGLVAADEKDVNGDYAARLGKAT